MTQPVVPATAGATAPRRPGRLKVFLGAAPGVGKTYRLRNEARRGAGRGTDVVVGFVECPGSVEPPSALERFRPRVQTTPMATQKGSTPCGFGSVPFRIELANYLDLGEQGWWPLVKALNEVMARGNGSKLLQKAYDQAPGARVRPWAGVSARSETSGGTGVSAFVAITCADSNLRPGFTRAEKMIKRTKAASTVFGEAWSSIVYLCYDWPFEGERATPDVSADGAPPILVVANTGDPTTPYAGAKRMVGELGKEVGVLLTVRAEGHGSYPYNRCATRVVNTYLLDDTPPGHGTTCS